MNSRITILLTCLLLLVGSWYPLADLSAQSSPDAPFLTQEVTLGDEQDGQLVELREDQVLVISLESKPSAGYIWEVEQIDETIVRRNQGESPEFQSSLDQSGVTGLQVLRFSAVGAGQAWLKLVYHRPWEEDVAPKKTFSVLVRGAEPFTGANIPTPTPFPSYSVQPALSEALSGSDDVDAQALPSSLNLCDQGACTPVKDQADCGSCWAFATVGLLESAIKTEDNVVVDLSEQYLVSCNTDGWGCDGGNWAHDYHLNKIPPGESAAGAVLESDFPYVAADVACNAPHTHHQRITSWDYVSQSGGIPTTTSIKQAIYDYGPVAVGICAGNAFSNYTGGIFATDESSACAWGTDHAVILVGWDDSQQVWHLRNSWGTAWGENGYMRIRYGTSNVGYDATYIVYNSSPSPNPTATPTSAPPGHIVTRLYLPVMMRRTASPTPTPTPKSSGLVNGDFEDGQTGWTEYSWNGWPLIYHQQDLIVTTYNGSWAAWLGGSDYEASYLGQQVTVPIHYPYLVYWHWISSEDLCGYDFGGVIINDYTVVDEYNLCSDTNTGGWVKHVVNLTAYAGQSVWLDIAAETDYSYNSNLFVDAVSFQASASSGSAPSGVPIEDTLLPKTTPSNRGARPLVRERLFGQSARAVDNSTK